MPRESRIVIPGELFHLTQRGNYCQDIFDEVNDKIQYLKYFEKYSQKYKLDVFAYCLMDNHVYFIVRPFNKDSMAQTICRVYQRYSVYYHTKNKKRGHLWQERYYSCLLQGNHIKHAVRYVECNPVRAKMVSTAWEYDFSSARAHLGKKYKLITLADISQYVDVLSWKKYLLKKEEENVLTQLHRATMKGLVLGLVEYVRFIEKQIGRKIIKLPGRPKKRACCH